MRLISWNVNGVRAVWKKGFGDWFKADKADVVCLQETKAQPDQLTPEALNPHGYHGEFHWGERENFSDGFTSEDYRIQFSFKYDFSASIGGN